MPRVRPPGLALTPRCGEAQNRYVLIKAFYVVLLAAVVSCGGADTAPHVPEPFPDHATFVDLNADPNVLEVMLTAEVAEVEYLPGKKTSVWAYRDAGSAGSVARVPGPLLDARLEDRIIVHLQNSLPVATTIHWHGVRLPPSQDGTPVSQIAVPPGGSYTYEFVAMDSGSYWYHPHLEADEQIERGLYGAIIIRDEEELPVHADRYLVLDDVKVEANGALAIAPTGLDVMMGRQGNVLLVNGVAAPRLEVPRGTRERWRIVNTANGRFFNLLLGDIGFSVVAWDGGLLPEPYQASTLLVAPGERYDVIVEIEAPTDSTLTLQSVFYDRGHGMRDTGPDELMQIQVTEAVARPLEPLPAVMRQIELPSTSASTMTRRFVLTEDMESAEPQFFINAKAWPLDPDMTAAVFGDTEIWEVVNDTGMDHPFQLHGMFFHVLERGGAIEPRRGWKDTVVVPQHSNVRFAVTYDAAGMWMYHCHILEHAERGMMGVLHVE